MSDLPEQVQQLESDERALVVVDSQGFIVLMTKAAEELCGVSLDDIRGEAVELLVPEKLRFGHQAYRRGFISEEKPREMDPGLEPELERPMDGTRVPIDVWLEPMRADGKLYVVADVKERAA
ncbi:MAG TPA: PAS domain S-box protein [Acidimicrobiales bacterium]|nr:PAS domain S-box protein [Acidimicrobiales bacterium]